MHVKEIEGVGSFVTIEDALLDHDHPVAISTPVDDAGTYTAAGALTSGDERIDTQIVQVPSQWRAPERTGRRFAQDGFAGQGCDLDQ